MPAFYVNEIKKIVKYWQEYNIVLTINLLNIALQIGNFTWNNLISAASQHDNPSVVVDLIQLIK